MDIIAAYSEVGTYRRAAQVTGTTHKTVKRVIARHEAGGGTPARAEGPYLRRRRGAGGRAGEDDVGEDLGEAAAAGRPGGGVGSVRAFRGTPRFSHQELAELVLSRLMLDTQDVASGPGACLALFGLTDEGLLWLHLATS